MSCYSPDMDRPPRLVMVFDWELDDAMWRPADAEDTEVQITTVARGMGYEPVLDDVETAAVAALLTKLQEYRDAGYLVEGCTVQITIVVTP
jgi:hypothetical protein